MFKKLTHKKSLHMKKYIFLLVFPLFFMACKKEKDDDNNDKPAPVETVTDANGNVYNVVSIGSQKWTATNMKANVTGSYVYDNNSNDIDIYGRLYNWDGAKTACPNGWRLPTENDFKTLSQFLGGEQVAGGKMKNAGTTYWQTPNTGGTNSSGYNAMPAGYRNYTDGVYFGKGQYTYFWTSTDCST